MNEVEQMEAIRQMKDTEGWKLIEKFIWERIRDHKNQLETCKIEDVFKHRYKAESYRSVLLYLEGVIDEGMKSLQNLPP